ncbi:hypothetical protein W97_06977 [Coniosporium apollinis CBS 100218]|uniref:Uncharacterized protein n=1 Tax=Coniosporium apollinis (strain CBS 100218) TaxID=1168221 RepID=R7Z0R5_CONA1|nr:uncharacterized protein W97_06977 [Coniosporium apollinis CBS 100218]EON67609.1 hypothetical protein W97_06977 [Coniosporium apollinis CBS 100218]
MTELVSQPPLHRVDTNASGSASADTADSAEAVQSAWGTIQAVSTEPTSAGLSQPPPEDDAKDDGGREAAPSTISSVAAFHGSSGESDDASTIGGSAIDTDTNNQHQLIEHSVGFVGGVFETEAIGSGQAPGPFEISDDEIDTEGMAGDTARPSSEVEVTGRELQAVPPEENPIGTTGIPTGYAPAARLPNG